MTDETATNPVEGADTSLEDTEAQEQEVEQQDEPELDEFGEPIIPADEDEEVELDDLKLKVPKSAAQKVKDGFLRQADYTRKTQELAKEREAVQAERAAVQQADAAEMNARGQLASFDQQIAHMGKIDWDQWENEDPFEAQKGWRQFQTLQQQRGQLAGQLSQHVNYRTIVQQQETAKRVEEGRAVLAREIKGWNDQLAATLLDTGVKEYGFNRAEIESFEDPRMVKVLHDAHLYRQSLTKTKQAKTIAAVQAVVPAARVGGGSAPSSGLDDRASTDTWMKARDKQVRKRA